MGMQQGIPVRAYKRRDVAESAAETLKALGVSCWLQDAAGETLVAGHATRDESVAVVVSEEDAARAEDAIDAFEARLVQPDQPVSLTCPHCGSNSVSRHSMGLRQLLWWRVICWNPKLPLFPRKYRCVDCGKMW